MGTVAPNPFYTEEIAKTCMETIFLPTIRAMKAEGREFRGCLYFGLMLTKNGPKVIEYNCRFGDPETQVVLPLLESDLLTVMQATTNGTLADCEVKFKDAHACCVVLASMGYPVHYEKGYNNLIVTNGNQTDTIYDGLKDGKTFSAALESREFEPDGPNFTPRISGMLTFGNEDFTYQMSILKSADAEGSACNRFTYVPVLQRRPF